MASLVRPIISPFRTTYRYLQRQAHESPVIFWSCILGFTGPVLVIAVPPVRRSLGYKTAERPPTTYPLPSRTRRPVQGYEDE